MRKIKKYSFWLNIEWLGRLMIVAIIILFFGGLERIKLNVFEQICVMIWGIIMVLWVNAPIWN